MSTVVDEAASTCTSGVGADTFVIALVQPIGARDNLILFICVTSPCNDLVEGRQMMGYASVDDLRNPQRCDYETC